MTDFKKIYEIAQNINTKEIDYKYIGIRVQEENESKIGDIVTHKSNVWEDGEILEEKLNGVCAIDVNETKSLKNSFGGYFGEIVLILGSNNVEYGNDTGEIIMEDPIILNIINLEE